jgi:hypothetical protein
MSNPGADPRPPAVINVNTILPEAGVRQPPAPTVLDRYKGIGVLVVVTTLCLILSSLVAAIIYSWLVRDDAGSADLVKFILGLVIGGLAGFIGSKQAA